jgi:type IV pilus assembly protein PilB
MRSLTKRKLGDLLVESKKVTDEQLKEVLTKQKNSGMRLGEILVAEGLTTENDILSVLEMQLGIPRVYLDFVNVDEKALKVIPESLASKYNLLPIYFDKGKLTVVMSDPLNIFAFDDVKMASGYEVEPLLASQQEIKKAISKYYSSQFVQKAAEDLNKEQISNKLNSGLSDMEDILSQEDIKNAPVVRLIDSVIDNAVKARASDIHIEPFEKYVKIRYRVDGELQEMLRSPKETLGALTTRIKILANLNIAEKRLPQDGRILTTVDNKAIDLRVSVLPTVNGEKVVIRILSKESFLIGKEELGMYSEDLDKLNRIMESPYGIILVTGPTGSGKSTTLYTVLQELNTESKNIITVEDPVEFLLEGVNQVSVNTKAGLTFASGLRSILRQDPDIIMIGEIRDNETAEIAVRSAITGHVVLSTIHTNDAPSSVVRLADMGIEPYLIATSISGVVAQRLVRKICPKCREEYEPNDYERKILNIGFLDKVKLLRGKGCPYCNNTGYKGRIGTYEIMEITREHRELIMNNGSSDELKDLSIKNGMRTLRMSCTGMVLDGVTTVEELMRIAYLNE